MNDTLKIIFVLVVAIIGLIFLFIFDYKLNKLIRKFIYKIHLKYYTPKEAKKILWNIKKELLVSLMAFVTMIILYLIYYFTR